MTTAIKVLVIPAALALCVLALPGCGCGFDCNSNARNPDPASLSLGFVDETLEQLKQVVIEVDRITLRRSGVEDVVVDTFTIPALGLTAADTFQLDLLQYRGLNQLLVFTGLALDAGTYSSLQISILDGDVNRSYVQESDDSLKPIAVSDGVLPLTGPALASGTQEYTVVFSLAQALQFRQASADYLLTTQGIRVMDNAVSASLVGRVDSTLFDTVAPCDAKADPEAGNRIYLYSASGSTTGTTADVYTASGATTVPANTRAPYAVAALAQDVLTGGWQYAFGFIEPGSYSLAFSCDAADDDPVNYDGLVIPLPTDQLYELELSTAEQAICDLAAAASCS